jgi:hypothetical protein
MPLIPVWQQAPSGIAETNIGVSGSPYNAAFWQSQGIFSTEARPCITNFRGDEYIIGAYSRPVFRLAADKQWYPAGIVPPFFPVSIVLAGSGTGIAGAGLGYITFLQKLGDRVVQESNPSNVVDFGTMAGEERVWSNIQNTGAEYHVTHVRGYVSMDGGDYRMAWEAPYGLTTITESTPTAALSHLGPNFDHNIPPSGVLYGHPFAGRMAYANNAQYPYRVWISKPGFPQYVPEANFRDTYAREPITGLWRGRNELIIFCLRNSYLLRQFGSGENDFVLERLDSNVGCISHFGIQEIHNRLWFPGEDGIWIYDGGFHYLMPDLRKLWQDDYAANQDAFQNGFAGHDRINKVYIYFTNRSDRPEWENTQLNPGTIRYVGYYASFEPSMLGEASYPEWSLDFLDRFDSAALYNQNAELLIASCDGIVRKQDDADGDDDGDLLQKELIIRTGHNLFGDPGGDIQSGKKLDQVWVHCESESNAWEFRCLGGDEEAWNQVFPDNVRHFWKADIAASAETQQRTYDDGVYEFTYVAKAVHFLLPEQVVGRGFTFETRAVAPIGMKYRGVGGMWSPGAAHRVPQTETLL